MLKDTLRKLGPEFGVLAEEQHEVEQETINRLDRSVKLDEVDTITFGLETDDGKIVKVYVKVDQADDFEKALGEKLGEIDDIEEVLNELSKEYEIVDVEWPAEEAASDDDADEDDGSDSLNKKVYDNPKENAEKDRALKPKLESLSIGEELTISLNEGTQAGSLESRFTTAAQLMIYHAVLELGIPELALSRNPYRSEILKNIKHKALELTKSPTMKNALKMFINRSIDYEDRAEKNNKSAKVNESLIVTEGVAQDFWNAFLYLVNYVAATPEDAKDFLKNPTLKQLMTRSSAPISSNVSSQIKTKLNDFKNSIAQANSSTQLKAAGVAESYLNANEKLTEGASPAEVTDLFKALLTLADASKDGSTVTNIMKSSSWNSFFNSAKSSLSQKFGGPARAKLNQLKAVLPKTTTPAPSAAPTATESRAMFSKVLGDALSEEKSLKNASLAHAYSYGSEKFDAGYPIEVIGEEGDSYIVKPFPIMANGHMKLKKSAVKLTGKINVPDGGPGGKMPGGLNEALKKGDRVKINVKNWSGTVDQTSKGIGLVIGVQGQAIVIKLDDTSREVLVYPNDLSEVKQINESQVPEWSFEMDGENVVIQCATLKVILNDEEVEKLVKGLSNKDAVIVRDEEDPTHKVAFSPRGSSVMVKKVGTPEGIMMKQGDVDDLFDFVSKGEDEEKPVETPPEDDAQPAGGDESAAPKDEVKA